MIALGVDPPNGWAVVDGDRRISSGQWSKRITDAKLAMNVVEAVDLARSLGARVMGIEGQFWEWRDSVEKKKRAGLIRSALVLSSRSGMWKQEWLRQSGGMPLVVLPPSDWRRSVLGRGAPRSSAAVNAYVIQMMSLIYRRDLRGAELREDEANAVGIARCVSVDPRWVGVLRIGTR